MDAMTRCEGYLSYGRRCPRRSVDGLWPAYCGNHADKRIGVSLWTPRRAKSFRKTVEEWAAIGATAQRMCRWELQAKIRKQREAAPPDVYKRDERPGPDWHKFMERRLAMRVR